jgi:hypothetical protein
MLSHTSLDKADSNFRSLISTRVTGPAQDLALGLASFEPLLLRTQAPTGSFDRRKLETYDYTYCTRSLLPWPRTASLVLGTARETTCGQGARQGYQGDVPLRR